MSPHLPVDVHPWPAPRLDGASNSTSITFPASPRHYFSLYLSKLQLNYLSTCRMTTVSSQTRPWFWHHVSSCTSVQLKPPERFSCFWTGNPHLFSCDTSYRSSSEPLWANLLIFLLTLCMRFPSSYFTRLSASFFEHGTTLFTTARTPPCGGAREASKEAHSAQTAFSCDVMIYISQYHSSASSSVLKLRQGLILCPAVVFFKHFTSVMICCLKTGSVNAPNCQDWVCNLTSAFRIFILFFSI